MKRNSCIELIKFVFAICVALGNFSVEIVPSSIVIMLFFILSGYFLIASFDSGKYCDPWRYSLGRIKRVYPYYFAAFVMIMLYVGIGIGLNVFGLASSFLLSMPELLLVQNVGIFPGGMNYPLWQMSTLIVASHIFFALLQWNRSLTTNVLCPLLGLAVFTYLSGGNGYVQPNPWGVEFGFIYMPLLRAAGGLAVGMFLYDPVRRMLKHLHGSELKLMPVLVSLAGVALLAMLWLTRSSYAVVLTFAGILIWSFYEKGLPAWLSGLPVGRLDKLSLGLYLNHALVGHVFRDHPQWLEGMSTLWKSVIYLAVLMVYTVVMILVVDLIMKLVKKLARRKTDAAKV